MALQATTVARQWLSSDHVGTPTDTNATIAQQQRNSGFCVVRTEMFKQAKLVRSQTVSGVKQLVGDLES
jgi:hypothetical protein